MLNYNWYLPCLGSRLPKCSDCSTAPRCCETSDFVCRTTTTKYSCHSWWRERVVWPRWWTGEFIQ